MATTEPPPLISASGRADLERIGREMHAPPYPGRQPRIVTPDGSDYFLHAVDVLGTMPRLGTPEWKDFEDRFCPELLSAVESAGGGWAWAGALVVASDMDMSSQHPKYLLILDRALAFIRGAGVPYAFVPAFAFDRWAQTQAAEGVPFDPGAWERG
jgi:hypothetical protein